MVHRAVSILLELAHMVVALQRGVKPEDNLSIYYTQGMISRGEPKNSGVLLIEAADFERCGLSMEPASLAALADYLNQQLDTREPQTGRVEMPKYRSHAAYGSGA